MNGIAEKETSKVGEWKYKSTGTAKPADKVKHAIPLPAGAGSPDELHTYNGPIPDGYEIVHRRGNDFLHSIVVAKVENRNIIDVIAGETHQNYWPAMALGGLGSISHAIFENGSWFGGPPLSYLYNNRTYLDLKYRY